jgi:hypothetical protein
VHSVARDRDDVVLTVSDHGQGRPAAPSAGLRDTVRAEVPSQAIAGVARDHDAVQLCSAGFADAAAEATARAAAASSTAADATREMAETADKQLEELRLAREAAVRPYLHVNNLVPVPQNEQDPLSNIVLQVSIVNLGPRPGLSVRRHVNHPCFVFDPGNDARVIRAGDTVDQFIVGRAREFRSDVSNQQWQFLIRLEYRDLLGQLWVTITTARAGWLERGLVRALRTFQLRTRGR